MALPRVNNPTYMLDLPSTGEKIKYRPFLVKEQKVLMMAQDTKKDAELAETMGQLVSSCTYGKVKPETSPMFDMEYAFLKIRSKSVGSKVDVMITCPDDEVTQVKTVVDLDEIEVQMLDNHSNEVNITDDVKIEFRYPILNDMIDLKDGANDVDRVFHILEKCITSIHFGDDVYQKTDITEKELNTFVDELTGEQFETLVDFFSSMPKLRHVVKITNPKTKVKSEVVLEGLESFLE